MVDNTRVVASTPAFCHIVRAIYELQNDCALEMNFRKLAMWSKRASELEDITRISELKSG